MIKKKEKNSKLLIILIISLISLYILISPLQTFCATQKEYDLIDKLNNSVVNELNEIKFDDLNKIIEDFSTTESNLFSIENIKTKIYEIISGKSAINYESVIAFIFSNLIEMVVKYLPSLSVLIAIGVTSNLLNGFKSKSSDKSTGDLINLICFLTSVALIVGMIMSIVKTSSNSINTMIKQMDIIFPILLTLMTTLGATAGVSTFRPIVAIMSTYVGNVFDNYILPLFIAGFAFAIISNISNNIKLDKFSSFINSLFKWSVGIVFTLFFAVFSVQGITAGSFDSISVRTTKYTMKSYIPIIGGYLSDGMDLIIASSVLIKNSIGLVGILLIISTILSPILEIVIFSLMMKLVAAILQPLGNTKISNFLTTTSKTITMLSTTLIAIGFMYVISLGLLMTTCNVVV